MKKLSITVGIPAYNEEKNIKNIVKDVYSQVASNFVIKEVVVVSDGSKDNTSTEAGKIKRNNLKVLSDKKRLGKPTRVNQIFAKSKSDVVIILDADIRIKNDRTFERLIAPMIKNPNIQLSSGMVEPAKPLNLSQDVAHIGVKIWKDCRTAKKVSDLYWCDGSVRAFGKKLYKSMKFPKSSADEAFSYLACIDNGFSFVAVKSAVAINVLPDSFKDYVNQTRRFLLSYAVQTKHFDQDTADSHYNIGYATKAKVCAKYFVKSPVLTSIYLSVSLQARILNIFDNRDTSKWEIISSTKKTYAIN